MSPIDETRVVRSRGAAWGVIGALLVLALVGIWLLPREDQRPGMGVRTATDETTAVATTGADPRGDRGLAMGREGITTSPILRQLEILTGIEDRHALVGRRVDLEVARGQVPHHVAFWVGEPRDRVLVVLARDTRDGAARQRGLGPDHAVDAGPHVDRVRIVGTVARIPYAEATSSWGLSRPEYADLVNRGFYIHAQEVLPVEP